MPMLHLSRPSQEERARLYDLWVTAQRAVKDCPLSEVERRRELFRQARAAWLAYATALSAAPQFSEIS